MNIINIANLDIGALFMKIFMKKKSQTVLVVEDNSLAAEAIRDAAAIADINVIVVSSGEEAIGVLRSNGRNYICAIIDISLPGMNGIDLWAKISEEWPNLETFIITLDTQNLEKLPRGRPISVFLKSGTRYCSLFSRIKNNLI